MAEEQSNSLKAEGEVDTSKTPKTYTKEEYEAAKARTAEAVEKRLIKQFSELEKDYSERIKGLEIKLKRTEALDIFKKLNGNPKRFEALIKLNDINLSADNVKEQMAEALEKYPEFRKQVKEKIPKEKEEDKTPDNLNELLLRNARDNFR